MARKTSKSIKAEKQPVAKGEFMFIPPKPDVCQECATKHPPGDPHNRDSLFYQMKFQAAHGRHPQWSDAVAHCTSEVQAFWKEELEKAGVWSEPIERLVSEDKVAREIGGFPVHSEKDQKGDVMFAGMTEIDLGKKRKFAKGNEKIEVGVMMIKKEGK
jgi:hypothetical protein